MQWIRQLALGACLLCAAAGMIRIFWPDNQFKPVINTVLLLYILTSVLQMGAGADWDAVASEISQFESPTISAADLTDYQEQLGRDVSVQALQMLFADRGIEADFTWDGDTLRVILQQETDRRLAQNILAENAGSLPFVVDAEGGK